MSYIWYIYSIDDNIKISQLKSWEYPKDTNIDNISKYISDNKIHILIQNDNMHNKFLNIKSKPYIIYAIWNLDILNKKIIAIVWPRKPSEYGSQIVSQIIPIISNKENIATISGLAEWIDTIAHTDSIKNKIPTIAVLGWWLSYYLSGTSKSLIQKIINNWWLVISEFKLKQKPAPYTFPQRNRIVAWLSDMIILPEAKDWSWSLITAKFWLDMQKPIYIIPNSILNPNSYGSNKLLNESWTHPIYDMQKRADEKLGDSINNINPKSHINTNNEINKDENLSETQKLIIKNIISQNNTIDKILSQNKNIEFNQLISEITILEIEWYIYSNIPWQFEYKKN